MYEKWERKFLSNFSFQRKKECNICCFACFIPLRIIFTDFSGCYCCFGCFFPLSLRIIFPDPQTQMVISGLSMEHACQWFSIVWAFVLSAQTNMAVCTFSFLNPPHVCLKTSSSSIVVYCLPGQIWQWILFYSKSAVCLFETSSLTGFLIQTSHGSFWILYGSYLTSWEPFGPIWFLCRRMKEREGQLYISIRQIRQLLPPLSRGMVPQVG